MLNKKIANLLRARFPYIYLTTYEEERATAMLRAIVNNEKLIKFPREIYIWTQTNGFINDETEKPVAGTANPAKALDFVQKHDKDSIFIFYDIHVNFGMKNRAPDYDLVRKLRDLVPDLKVSAVRKNIFFIAPEAIIPETLQKDITICDFPLPALERLKRSSTACLRKTKR